jgi:hypothetical protein
MGVNNMEEVLMTKEEVNTAVINLFDMYKVNYQHNYELIIGEDFVCDFYLPEYQIVILTNADNETIERYRKWTYPLNISGCPSEVMKKLFFLAGLFFEE